MARMLVAAHKHDCDPYKGVRSKLRALEKYQWRREVAHQ